MGLFCLTPRRVPKRRLRPPQALRRACQSEDGGFLSILAEVAGFG